MIVNLLKNLGIIILDSSYWICLTVCLLSLIIYIAGQKKAGKYVTLSFVIYILLQSLKEAIK